jgi:predicted nucleic acid-binding protein
MARTAGTSQPQALVLDAHPLAAFINGEPGAEHVRSLLESARAGTSRLSMTVVNAAEVMLVQERRGGAQASHRTLDLLQDLPIRLVNVDLELAARAAYLKMRGGISFADCFAAALAHRDGIPVLTGDREFERVADLVHVRWLLGRPGVV